MAITFLEETTNNGNTAVRWVADTPREWKRALYSVKHGIPKNGRVYEVEKKRWIVVAEYLESYQVAKQIAQGGDDNGQVAQYTEEIDNLIDNLALVTTYNPALESLPDSMKARALWAIKAAMGLVDAPCEYSMARGAYGAYHEEEHCWLYDDGRYSEFSPSEWDERAFLKGQEKLRRTIDRYPKVIEGLDESHNANFRFEMLLKYEYRCFTCGIRPTEFSRLHMHRVLPGKQGGEYTENNVVIVCASCHKRIEGLSWDDIGSYKQSINE